MLNLFNADVFFAMAGSGSQGSGLGAGISSFIPLLLMVLIFYLLLFRPQQKKEKERKKMIDSIKEGDRVLTISGIYGTVSALRDDVVILKVAKGTEIEFTRSSIHAKIS